LIDHSTGRKAFLTIISAWVLLSGCGLAPEPDKAPEKLDPQELFLVEQYLRVVEVRGEALRGAEEADSLLDALAAEIPVDSIMSIAARVSRERPDRWRPIFQEIVRRIDLLPHQP